MSWISVGERLPEPGSWVNVLVDRNVGDYWDRRNRPRYHVYGAQLRSIDSEGHASWQQWESPDGGPIRGRDLHLVTHWQPYPEPPPMEQETEDDC